jgi:hypothetical protein
MRGRVSSGVSLTLHPRPLVAVLHVHRGQIDGVADVGDLALLGERWVYWGAKGRVDHGHCRPHHGGLSLYHAVGQLAATTGGYSHHPRALRRPGCQRHNLIGHPNLTTHRRGERLLELDALHGLLAFRQLAAQVGVAGGALGGLRGEVGGTGARGGFDAASWRIAVRTRRRAPFAAAYPLLDTANTEPGLTVRRSLIASLNLPSAKLASPRR